MLSNLDGHELRALSKAWLSAQASRVEQRSAPASQGFWPCSVADCSLGACPWLMIIRSNESHPWFWGTLWRL